MFCLYPLSMCFKSNNKCNTSMNLRLSLTVVKRSVTISELIINIQHSLFIPYLDLSDCVKTVPCRWLQWIMIRSSRVVMRGSRKNFQGGGGGVSDGYLSLLRRGGGCWNFQKLRYSLFTCVRILIGRTLRQLKVKEIQKRCDSSFFF